MSRLSADELKATHRIFNHVDQVVNYYGHKTLDETAQYVSENKWIMFPASNITSLREGTTYPLPNVFVSPDDEEISDDGDGRITGWIGFTYHNVEAMEALRAILRRPMSRGKVLLRELEILSDDWSVQSVHKIKTDSEKSTPKYSSVRSIAPSAVTIDAIGRAIDESDRTLPRKGDLYANQNPILWAVTTFSVERWTTPTIFDKDIRKAFDMFLRLVSL